MTKTIIRFELLMFSLVASMLLASVAEAAVVGYEGRHFSGVGGRGGVTPQATPCCTSMGTFDTRTTGFVTSMTTSGTQVFPAGNPYLAENFPAQHLVADVNPTNGAIAIEDAPDLDVHVNPFLPPGWVLFVQTRTTQWNAASFGPNQGMPDTWSHKMSANPYTTMGVVTGMTSGGATTTMETTVSWHLNGQASGTAGPNRFGGTWEIIGKSVNHLAIVGAGTVQEILIPVPNGPGIPLPNAPPDVTITRAVAPAFVKIHVGTLNGPTVASILGPVVHDAFPFTTGTVMFNDTSRYTPITAPLQYHVRTDTGFDNRTTASYLNGTLQLVSGALQTSYTGSGDPLNGQPSAYSRIAHLNFVPEPGSLALIGSGVLGLACVSLVSRRRTSPKN